jgi:hypothetical protein
MTGRNWGILLALVAALGALACTVGIPLGDVVRGSGDVAEEVREVSGFRGVELATQGEVIIELGDEEGLRIEAQENLLPYFTTEVRTGVLRIDQQPGRQIRPTEPVRFYVTAQELDTLIISGSGNIRAPGLEAPELRITIAGSGNVHTGDLDADELNVEISGSGNVETGAVRAEVLRVDIPGSGDVQIEDGQVEEQGIEISGSGDYSARDLASAAAEVSISGSGAATLRVEDRLRVSISGSGDVRYAGSPEVDRSISGSGDVEQIGD